MLSREWRCSWSSADRRCSNYIWVINNLIAQSSASYIRDLAVIFIALSVFTLYFHGSHWYYLAIFFQYWSVFIQETHFAMHLCIGIRWTQTSISHLCQFKCLSHKTVGFHAIYRKWHDSYNWYNHHYLWQFNECIKSNCVLKYGH